MHRESRWLEGVTARPIYYFAVAFVVAMVALLVVLQLVAMANTGEPGVIRTILGRFAPSLASIDVSSAAIQAVIGTAVVGASAIVAFLVAVSALQASLASNVLSDPDYVLSHNAYSAYRKYGFLVGSLIAAYRTHRHEQDLASYERIEPSGTGGKDAENDTPTQAAQPPWNSIVAELRELLLDTSFQVAALEAAKVLDAGAGDENQHRLRKAFATAISALDQEGRPGGSGRSPEHALTVLLAHASTLDIELRRGLDKVGELHPMPKPNRLPKEGERLLHYLAQWMPRIGTIQVGEDFQFAARANAFAGEEFAASFGSTWQKMFDELLNEVFDSSSDWKSGPCVDPFENGLHRAMRIAAVCGDHVTAMQLREQAEKFAKDQGLKPTVVVVRNKASLPPPTRAGSNDFMIFHVTRKTLPLLFGGNALSSGDVLGPHTRGCVIVDGLRSGEMGYVEERVEHYFSELGADGDEPREPRQQCETCRPCAACGECTLCRNCKDPCPSRFEVFVDVLTQIAYSPGHQVRLGDTVVVAERVSSHLTDDGRPGINLAERDKASAAEGPKLVWVGVDYRQIGVEPPTRLDDWSSEMWAMFKDYGAAVSDEVRELTKL